MTGLQSLLKIAALTFAGAFLSALTITSIPTTLDGWKMAVMPALAAAIASEIVYLRSTITKLLTEAATATSTTSTPSTTTTTTVTAPAAILTTPATTEKTGDTP